MRVDPLTEEVRVYPLPIVNPLCYHTRLFLKHSGYRQLRFIKQDECNFSSSYKEYFYINN